MAYIPNVERYTQMEYRRCGRSGLKLPLLSMGLWHNFGDTNSLEHMAQLCETAFDGGITHFDLANNYGPPAGAAERNFGKLLKTIFAGHRDELVISTKAGYDMWEGPYGEWGSRKYLLASLDQSLQRLGLDYVDIFYHHRPDPETPLEETMGALAQAVQSGKALYVGLSNYDGETMSRAAAILEQLHCPFIINQNRYSILDRVSEKNGILSASEQLQKGVDIANIVDSVGGIPITLPEQITYEADKILPAGEQTLNGQQSEWFVRFRHGYAEGDIGRVKAQRIFLAAAMEKMLNMSQTELMSAMQKIYKNQWIATDLSLEQISMVADFASQRLTMDNVNVFMVPGEGATYYPGDGSPQSVYSIHKSATVDLLNQYFRPYQNEIYPEESTIVELVPEGEYLARDYDDTQENLGDINKGDSNDGAQ